MIDTKKLIQLVLDAQAAEEKDLAFRKELYENPNILEDVSKGEEYMASFRDWLAKEKEAGDALRKDALELLYKADALDRVLRLLGIQREESRDKSIKTQWNNDYHRHRGAVDVLDLLEERIKAIVNNGTD